jgi:hypothetical protein
MRGRNEKKNDMVFRDVLRHRRLGPGRSIFDLGGRAGPGGGKWRSEGHLAGAQATFA